jgi:RNA polymerase sigma-B factor
MALDVSLAGERARLVEQFLPLVDSVARRYRGHGERHEDLTQVAALALVQALDRRDPARSAALPAYLSRCVEGAVLRHLRDRSGAVRVPRALQTVEARASLDDSSLAAIATARRPVAFEDDADGIDPTRFDEVTLTRELASEAMKTLSSRDRQIVVMLFFLDYTQGEVAYSLGISQAHVSRLLDRACAKMRRRLERPASLSGPNGRARLGTGDGTGTAAASRGRAVSQRPAPPAHATSASC